METEGTMAWSNGTSGERTVVSDVERHIIGGLLSVVAVGAFFGNILVMSAFALSRKLHNTTNYFVVSLSVADLITGLATAVNAVAVASPQHLPGWLCAWCGFSSVVCIGCGIYTLACIAVHRYLVVASHRQGRGHSSCKPVLVAIALTWTVPVTMASLPLIFGLGEFGYITKYSSCTWKNTSHEYLNYSFILASTYYPVPMVIIITSYIKIFLRVRQARRRINATANISARRPPGRQDQKAAAAPAAADKVQTAVTKNMFYVVCAFLVCMTPYTAALMAPDSDFFISYAAVILVSSSVINPVIYATKHPDFGKAMRNIVSCNFKNIPQFVLR